MTRRAPLLCALVAGVVARALVIALAAILAAGATAQPPPDVARPGPGYPKVYDPNMPFEPKDIAGIWTPNGAGYGGGGRCRDCGDRGFSLEFPEFTAAGQAAFDANTPSYGRAKGSDDAKAHPEEHIGRRRAQAPALGNDPYQSCNPMGMPRAILYPDPVEFLVLKDRILQHFEWGYGLRTVWMDGRRLPKPEEIDLPRWWGYAVGRWDGNTLVVTSTGHDSRTWVDHFGYPHSDQMVLEERYTRINYDTIELKMVLTDPEYYTKPWVAQTKRMHLIPQSFIQSSGWSGLLEDVCAPVDEVDTFNRLIRDPAGTGKPAAPPKR